MRRTVKHKDGSTSEKPHYAASSRRTVRSIVSGILQQAVLHKVIPSNPTRELERIESPRGHHKAPPRGLTAEERRRLLDFVDTNKAAIDADLKDLIRFALGSGLRIGELCAALDGRQPRRLPASQRAAAGKRGAVVAPTTVWPDPHSDRGRPRHRTRRPGRHRRHVRGIFAKLDVLSCTEAIATAGRRGLMRGLSESAVGQVSCS